MARRRFLSCNFDHQEHKAKILRLHPTQINIFDVEILGIVVKDQRKQQKKENFNPKPLPYPRPCKFFGRNGSHMEIRCCGECSQKINYTMNALVIFSKFQCLEFATISAQKLKVHVKAAHYGIEMGMSQIFQVICF